MILLRAWTVLVVIASVVAAGGPVDSRFTPAGDYSEIHGGIAQLILLDGVVVDERYPNGGAAGRATELASGTKSFAGVLALCAAADGLLDLDEPVAANLPGWERSPAAAATLRDLLTLTSGLDGGPSALAGGRVPSYAEAARLVPARPPGQRFSYGPAPFQAFGEVLRRKLELRGETVSGYLERRVLAPAGVTTAFWRTDADGQPHLPSGARLTAREWAKFGEAVRAGGTVWLPAGTLDACFEGTAANPAYGLTWWLPGAGPVGVAPLRRRSIGDGLPGDLRLAAGAGGQVLLVVPSLGLTAVRQAPVRAAGGARFDNTEWIRLVVQPLLQATGGRAP